MSFVDMNIALKAVLFDDAEAEERLRESGVTRRRLRRLKGPNRSRRAQRTDFARPGRLRFFAHGRSYPTKIVTRKELAEYPSIFCYSMGQVTPVGIVVAVDYTRDAAWVTS